MDKKTTITTKGRQEVGEVVSTKMNKTITIAVTRTHKHPLYKKTVTRTKNFKVHADSVVSIGQKVKIVESKPVSKDKHFKIVIEKK